MKHKIPDGALNILQVLKENGHQAYLVGGCVRDLLMGREPHDWDICTSALPSHMKQCFGGYKVIETGLKHGTLTVISENIPYEVTTIRVDGTYSDGRHPDTVRFTPELEQDLARRDFTMNAIAMDGAGEIHDPFGGARDIEHGLIRCVGDPAKRFAEDGLRIMRGMRFASVFDFDVHPDTRSAMFSCRKMLSNVSAERINQELRNLLGGKTPGKYLREYAEILCVFWPEIRACVGFDQRNPYHIYDVWQHITTAIDLAGCDDMIVRFALLLHDIAKPLCFTIGDDGHGHFYGHPPMCAEMADTMLRRLKFDNETRQMVVQLIEYHDSIIVPSEKHIKRWLNKIGVDQFRRLISVKIGDTRAHNPNTIRDKIDNLYISGIIMRDVIAKRSCFSISNLAINGNDVIASGVPEGPLVGKILKKILTDVINNEVENERDALIEKMSQIKETEFNDEF